MIRIPYILQFCNYLACYTLCPYFTLYASYQRKEELESQILKMLVSGNDDQTIRVWESNYNSFDKSRMLFR